MRENYDLPDGSRILIASDRISAFDVNLAVIPLKGQVLTGVARYWFNETRDICPNHVIDYPDPNVLVSRRLQMMPVEIVVRDYLAGTTCDVDPADVQAGQAQHVRPRVSRRPARQPEAALDDPDADDQGRPGRP